MKLDFLRKRDLPLHAMMLPGVILLLLFAYLPMGGIVIAFQRFIPAIGLFGRQKWIGLGNFEYMMSLPSTVQVVANTLIISVLKIVAGTVVPITVALMLNELRATSLKRTVQSIIYFPYFISWVILGGIMIDILSTDTGIVNKAIAALGMKPVFFLGDTGWFRATLVISDVWKSFGFSTVVYLAAIAGIDPTLYEVAEIDGASRFQKMRSITLPGMGMIIVLLMVLNLGNLLNAGFEQVFNLYSPQVYETGDIIDTLVYRLGLLQAQFGPATAVGLFKSLVSLILISASYYIAYRRFNYLLF